MEHAEFEEKDFEGALYHSLAAGFPHLWTPGQVFEHHFGIDAALHTVKQPTSQRSRKPGRFADV
jgi:hypothetical protein